MMLSNMLDLRPALVLTLFTVIGKQQSTFPKGNETGEGTKHDEKGKQHPTTQPNSHPHSLLTRKL